MGKEQLITKLKKGSMCITAFCLLAMLCNLAAAIIPPLLTEHNRTYVGNIKIAVDMLTKISLCRRSVSSFILAAVMLLAALMFFRIAKDGMPFSMKNAKTVRIISYLFLLNVIAPSAAVYAICRSGPDTVAASNLSALMEGLLFLFIAHIIRYGAMLQQESDETL
jgi:hypothetical protein